jgi:hypothetical protein
LEGGVRRGVTGVTCDAHGGPLVRLTDEHPTTGTLQPNVTMNIANAPRRR